MAIVLDPTNGITNVNGTAAAPAITGLDTDTGLYFGTNTLGLSTNGTASINVDSSQNVGINVTPNTGFKLTVQGPGTSTTKYSNPIARFQTNGSGYDGYIQISDNVANSIAIGQLSGATYFAQNGTESMRIDSSSNLLFNSGFGSVATAYGVRAWVYVSTPSSATIGGSANVSSVVRRSIGNYTVNFTNAMPDTNYAVLLGYQNSAWGQTLVTDVPRNASYVYIICGTSGANQDPTSFNVAIVR